MIAWVVRDFSLQPPATLSRCGTGIENFLGSRTLITKFPRRAICFTGSPLKYLDCGGRHSPSQSQGQDKFAGR